jgi:hypothetical protein
MLQDPNAISDAVLGNRADTVVEELKLTGKPELAVAVPKLIVCNTRNWPSRFSARSS